MQIRDGAYPLHILLAGPNVEIEMVENFIVEAPDILILSDKFGRTPLHVALENRKEGPIIDMLLLTEEGRQATQMSTQKENLPIHIAAAAGCSVQVAKALLLIHPNAIHQENCDGKNPFEVAMTYEKCSPDVIRLLEITDAAESE
jgi:ankyrin repeat protein